MTKIAESGSGSICQRHGSADPVPDLNVMDLHHWCWYLPTGLVFLICIRRKGSYMAKTSLTYYGCSVSGWIVSESCACRMRRVSEWPVLKTMPRRRVNREMASTSSRLAAAITRVQIPCTVHQFLNNFFSHPEPTF
jgi:hypothetical protein